jgi:hypothetical protein
MPIFKLRLPTKEQAMSELLNKFFVRIRQNSRQEQAIRRAGGTTLSMDDKGVARRRMATASIPFGATFAPGWHALSMDAKGVRADHTNPHPSLVPKQS